MGFLARITGAQRRELVAAQSAVSAAIADEFAQRAVDVPPATARASLGLATAFRCVALYVTAATSAGVIVERANRREPLPDWLRRPDAYGADVRLRGLVEYLVASMAGWGAGYLDVVPVGRTSWSMRTVAPERVTATLNPLTGDRQYLVDGRPVDLAYGPARLGGLLVVPYLTVPGVALPLGPLSAARLSMGEYLEVERYAGRIFNRGTVSGGRLETDVDITRETADRWAQRWQDKRADGGIPVLGAGLRYVNDVLNPADAQWIQSREYDAQEVARWFGVPPRYLGLPSGDASTYATARDNDAQLLRFGVATYADSIGETLSTLLPPGRNELEDERVRLDLDALLRGTVVDRVDVWQKALAAGWLTVDEVRASEGLDPLGASPAGAPMPSLPTAPGQTSVTA